ncbi:MULTISPECIES: bifunctional protein-serine/threonine kinase/phosphatase [unclassified Polaromonas]|uniref:bifunctional protein-serine/threonine kinase/phosphatase n=1 Tax=unclassified Polaromonas TaxID=2638319 RepID=UPI0018C99CB2|nr:MULTISPECIES: bifunctional protein-serine/threonine kinase/phosphatase [unclassified Polaromonas]MBG6072477.1 serine/threonine protein phosphatase PrpC [Polaromonas sp. CG_9.7]MBG6114481.1 serine/threonine protein phosphatase PrpC [Polaromonas sp. CG_9.2]MDH6185432.1 serine/threonine protein phosphatase PrpC [Polaromonas sp. CG_23.6]
MAFNIDIGFATQAGRKPGNEDFCAAMLPDPGQEGMGSIVAIADGVSAGGMGREAAQTTVTSLVRDYYATPETWDTTVALDRIIAAQNTWLAGINRRRQPVMGLTTLTALVLCGQSYTVAHVGDSRAYLLRGGEMRQLTHDHVVNHPDFRHQLLRSVGAEDHVVVDYLQGELLVGDIFVLVTDGVYGVLTDRRLQALAGLQATDSAPLASQNLVNAALAAGSQDNVTAVVVRVLGLLDASLPDVNRRVEGLPIPPRLMKVGEVIDGLCVTALVADSGINLLYQVRDSASQSLYALKTLHPARAHDAQERTMLAHEAWLATRMQTGRAADHLVHLHERLPSGRERSAFYLLYDWHSGDTLQQQLDRGQKFTVQQALAAATQTAQALARLHRQCVIHRDIKPANLHQGKDGVLRLLDLGVALSGREPEAMRQLHAGTPSFINPEQWGYSALAAVGPEELPDAQSDLFALGVTLYQLLTARLPYGEVLPYQSGRYYRDPVAPSRTRPEVPIWLDHIVLKAVARDKRQRFETAEELLLALERGASRPLTAPQASPLMQRDPTAVWKLALGVSLLFNFLLVYWLLFLPK